MAIDTQQVIDWLEALHLVYRDNRHRLTDLDAAIGDADHGTNMDRGFTAVHAALATNPPADPGAAFQAAAGVLIRTVGGAAGPLFGTFFLRAAARCAGAPELDAAAMVSAFDAGVEGVQQRGKAVAGEKTMLDALLPAVAAMRAISAGGASLSQVIEAGASAAEHGMLSTIPLRATKGRASYLGERSIGHQDPGATSSYLMLRAAADTWRGIA
ncbi:MAG: dihydroxyacetone kinase subunit DhaL [Bryobacteraceae bacterium]